MATSDEILREVKAILATRWSTRKGNVVPAAENVQLGNDSVELDATVLYADLAESTDLVDRYKRTFAAEVYKSYLVAACRIIRSNGGEITAFDGDRVMAVYLGESKNTQAARTALQINHAVIDIINTSVPSAYNTDYVLRQAVGVDTGSIFVARTGIRGSNDLVWVGPAANYAAKLCSLREGSFSSWITKRVFDKLNRTASHSYQGAAMWEERNWTKYNLAVYRSNWKWSL